MSFSQLRNKLGNDRAQIQNLTEYHRLYLSAPVLNSLEQLEGKYLPHLYNNLFENESNTDFKLLLNGSYNETNEYANECLEIAFLKTHLHGQKIKSWTNSALKCFDLLLIELINNIKGELIKKHGKEAKERDVYQHLIEKGGNEYTIGIAFQTIYQQRNSFTHVQFESSNGVRKTYRWSIKKYNKARDIILDQFLKGLRAFDNELKKYEL